MVGPPPCRFPHTPPHKRSPPNAKILLPILRHLRHLNPVAHRQKMRPAPARREQGKLRSLRGKREKRILLQILRLPRAVDTEPHRKEMHKTPLRREQGKLRACAVKRERPYKTSSVRIMKYSATCSGVSANLFSDQYFRISLKVEAMWE